MQQTTNYQLPQWEAGDAVKREDFNGAMSTIDAAIKAVAGKRLKIVAGMYRGTGYFGSANPNSLTFDFDPIAVCICAANLEKEQYLGGTIWIAEIRYGDNCGGSCQLTWTKRTLSWYSEASALVQLNKQSAYYRYIVVGYEE